MTNLLFVVADVIKAIFVDFGSFIVECFHSLVDILALIVKTSDLLRNLLLYLPNEFRPLLLGFISLLFCVLIIKLVSVLKGLI